MGLYLFWYFFYCHCHTCTHKDCSEVEFSCCFIKKEFGFCPQKCPKFPEYVWNGPLKCFPVAEHLYMGRISLQWGYMEVLRDSEVPLLHCSSLG